MPVPEYEIVHSIPGRIRLRIHRLKQDVDFATRLQALVSALKHVTEVRVDPLAASIVIHYGKNSLPQAQLLEQLVRVINQAADLALSVDMEVNVPGYSLEGLTAYEYLQFQEILAWRRKPFSDLANLEGKVLAPIQKAVDTLIPESLLKKVIPLLESTTENWNQEWENMKRQAKVDDLCQLKQIPLEQCDQLAKSAEDRAIRLASVEGGAGALLGVAGEMVDVDLFLRVSVQTIQRTGLCYGYTPETELERKHAWAILETTTALTNEEYRQALSRLQDLQQVLYQQAIADFIEDSIEGKLQGMAHEAILNRLLRNILRLQSKEVLPGVGVLMGIIGARAVINEASTAARREFQLRWLMENHQKENRSLPAMESVARAGSPR